MAEFKWFNIFLQHAEDMKKSQVLSVGFVDKFISKLKELLSDPEKNKEQLEISLPLLEKLLPHDY